jgi:hypothetical protein
MRFRKLIWLVLLIPVFLGIAIPGCSDKTFTSDTTAVTQNADPTAFLPLEQGLRVSYAILEPETKYFDLEVTDPVYVAGNPGYTIRKTDRTSGLTEVSYRYMKDNAIFESGSTQYPGVRILESPFTIGHTWDRFDTSSTTTVTGDIVVDNNEVTDDNPFNWYKTIPGDGYNTMTIVGTENVQALNGTVYGGCLKIVWQTDANTYNYYWYSAGIGLIKFEQNYNYLSASTMHLLGVMTDYQKVKY